MLYIKTSSPVPILLELRSRCFVYRKLLIIVVGVAWSWSNLMTNNRHAPSLPGGQLDLPSYCAWESTIEEIVVTL